jgi:hypothetical protein
MRVWIDGTKAPRGEYHDWVTSMAMAMAVLKSGKVHFLSLGGGLKDGKTGMDMLLWLERNPDMWPRGGVAIHYAPAEIRAAMEEIVKARYRRIYRS